MRSQCAGKIAQKDILWAIKDDPKKLHRARELLALDKKIKEDKKVFDVENVALEEKRKDIMQKHMGKFDG